ncbi:SDR family oxidoreductase [Streptomyces sp. NPDC048172]|uniref:SDR family oxidoreductase n=1 Tax=Streptomyces sp. NPDC048172 TaxID=3365505 RepID=UPI0037106978
MWRRRDPGREARTPRGRRLARVPAPRQHAVAAAPEAVPDGRPRHRRSVLVTEGDTGIGLAVARHLQAVGDRVAATYRAVPPDGEEFLSLPCDVTDARQVRGTWRAVEERHGPVEVLVANPGTSDARLRNDGTFPSSVVRESLYGMLRGEFGRIILMGGAVPGSTEGDPVHCATSKSALLDLARRLTVVYGSHGITANVVAPGLPLAHATARLTADQRAVLTQQIPLGPLARPEDIAHAVHWVSTAEGVSGAVIPVDGNGMEY